jgi:hypothetical protein
MSVNCWSQGQSIYISSMKQFKSLAFIIFQQLYN